MLHLKSLISVKLPPPCRCEQQLEFILLKWIPMVTSLHGVKKNVPKHPQESQTSCIITCNITSMLSVGTRSVSFSLLGISRVDLIIKENQKLRSYSIAWALFPVGELTIRFKDNLHNSLSRLNLMINPDRFYGQVGTRPQ